MRNSFNTASFSEVVHETRTDPAEAHYRYGAEAECSPTRGLRARVRPAILGTVKSARRFEQPVAPPGVVVPTGEPTPMELALTGIGSCTLKTLIGGGSARGVEFDAVRLGIEHGDGVGYALDIESDASPELVRELITQVETYSPNHRTVVEAIPVTVRFPQAAAQFSAGQFSAGESAARRLRWISGTQFVSEGARDSADVLRVDQPKQLAGVDWGPNPQEYLLMGMAADLANALAKQAGAPPLTWRVRADARVDVRGLLQADPAAPIPLQDVRCTVSVLPAESEPAEAALRTIVQEAIRRCAVIRLFARPHRIAVSQLRLSGLASEEDRSAGPVLARG